MSLTFANYYSRDALRADVSGMSQALYPVLAYAVLHHDNGIWYLAVAQAMLERQDLDGVAAARAPEVLKPLQRYGFEVFDI
ncbi:hypothetical protein [Mycolicibacterium diernhoferi]|uniref:Uncharacterized protein n=1 Tax=Mycolicibacterium diernhoferi TaxID=1801 RepID=A0A1Q4HLQ2_9MYCO|nr:hypothetical protein [Mycolicibacterium diernhoferi]OJZ68460.1 hypothetical protein BRW64_02475 [Mycolicibacterium diernhoferi]OPE55549.1 hypothetical protein BV510_04475 [Mycolicibacterium diernhoferi]PEG52091.1 hypothetical protein CRI78_23415 [Mycolicibacterium diernhoferi]QYL21041.1 hypothetical protein K0O62_18570 [Mycolicibacterium diernhoferi]